MRFLLLIVALALLVGCQPEFITADALEPLRISNEGIKTRQSIDALLIDHDARIAEFHARLYSAEEKIAFDATRAKRQLVGSSDTQRRDINNMIDVHVENARAEVSRERSRVDQSAADAKAEVSRIIGELSELDGFEHDRMASLVASARESLSTETLEDSVVRAETMAVRAAESIQNELNKLRR